MTNDNTTVATTDLTKAELQLALSKEGLAYQTLLQEGENIVFSRENVNSELPAFDALRKAKKLLEDAENPFTTRWKAWNEARKSLLDPVSALVTKKAAEKGKIAQEIAVETLAAAREKVRVGLIKDSIDNFFIDQSQAIAAATTLEELVRIEKLIGSNKSNASRYQEFLPLLVDKASNLTELIKVQKEAIKILDGLKKAENAAEAIGDDAKVLEMRENQEKITQTLEQGRIDVQEKAISMATKPDVVEPEIIVPVAPKARRSVWEWKMLNPKETMKKMPDWCCISVDKVKVDEYLKTKKAEGIEGEEFEFAGIKFYLQKSY